MDQSLFSVRHRRRSKKRALCFLLISVCLLFFGIFSFAAAGWGVLSGSSQTSVDDLDAWNLILVNEDHSIPFGYTRCWEFTELSNGEFVDSRIYPALQAMFDDARADNVYPVVASGYRSREQQETLLEEKIAAYVEQGYDEKEARRLALTYCALPGHSEHELGSAVDINADPEHSRGDEVYTWLAQNARYYGFIRRYPENKKELTGIADEPWHYRYVGRDVALEMEEKGLCLEEYHEKRTVEVY